jgi:hypothetical protein
MTDPINLANQKVGEALRNSCADAPRKEWGDQYGFIGGRVHADGTGEDLYLNSAGYDAFHEAIDRLLKVEEFARTVGRPAIVSKLADFLRRCNGKPPKEGLLRAFRREVVEPLRQEIYSWTCLIPLVNFLVKNRLVIGSVTFLSKEDARQELALTAGDAQAGALLDELECVQDEDRVDAFAKTTINAHEMQRLRYAEEIVLIAINMLRAFAPRLNPSRDALLCGLRSEVPRCGTHSVISIQSGIDVIDTRNEDDGSVLGNLIVSDKTVHQLREECQFEKLIAIASKPVASRTSFESAIFTSVQTLGQSMVAGSIGPAFSGCIAALECLAVPASTMTQIKATFATHLKCFFGDCRKAKEAYALRSDFVHTGVAAIAVEDLSLARRCAIDLILLALSKVDAIKEHTDFLSRCLVH